MANNSNLGAAKAAKNDEFYTQYADIHAQPSAKETLFTLGCEKKRSM